MKFFPFTFLPTNHTIHPKQIISKSFSPLFFHFLGNQTLKPIWISNSPRTAIGHHWSSAPIKTQSHRSNKTQMNPCLEASVYFVHLIGLVGGYFGHFRGLELFLVILEGLGYLWSFTGFGCIFIILKV